MDVLAVSKRDRKRRLAPRAKGTRYSMRIARSAGELTSSFRTARPDVVLVDRRTTDIAGRGLLQHLLAQDPSVPILIVEDIGEVKPDTLARVAGLSGGAAGATKAPG